MKNGLKNNWKCIVRGLMLSLSLAGFGLGLYGLYQEGTLVEVVIMVALVIGGYVLLVRGMCLGVDLIESCYKEKKEKRLNKPAKAFALILFVITLLAFSPLVYAEETKISFTFDDGSKSIFTNAFPILAKYSFPATVYVRTDCIELNPWCMNWNQVELLKRNGWRIGSHTNTHPHLTKLTDDEIKRELNLSIKILKDHGYNAKSFASPFGDFDQRVIKLVKERFKSHRRAWGGSEGLNDQNSLDKYDISACELKHDANFDEIKKAIDNAKKERRWLVLLLHEVVEGEAGEYQFSVSLLDKIAKYIYQQKIKVVTVSGYFEK